MDTETNVVIKQHNRVYYEGNKKVYKDCLSCAHGFIEECSEGNKLHCMLHNKEVKTSNYCSLWN